MTAADQTPSTDSERVEQIRARLDATTEGHWEATHRTELDWLSRSGPAGLTGHQPGSSICPAGVEGPLWGSLWPHRNAHADAEFITHAPDDVRYLLALLAEQAATIEGAHAELIDRGPDCIDDAVTILEAALGSQRTEGQES